MKALKWLLILIGGIAILAVGAVLWLLFGLDPNSFKPGIERLAAAQNIELEIRGELDWTLWPDIALEIGETHLTAPEQGSVSWRQAQLSLDKAALFKRQVLFNSINIEGANIRASSVAKAGGATLAPAAANELNQNSDLPFSLAVDRFQLSDSRVIIAKGQDTTININQLIIEQFSLDGKSFPVNLDIAYPAEPNVQLNGDIQLSVNADQQTLGFSGESMALRYQTMPAMKLSLAGSANGSENRLVIDRLNVSGQGFSAQAALNATADKITLNNLALSVNEHTVKGSGHLQLNPQRDLKLLLTGSPLNLDNLPGNTDTQANDGAMLAPLLAPLAMLEGGKGHIEISLPSVTSNAITVQEAHLNLFANANVVRISDLSGKVFGGQFQTSGKIDLRQPTPLLAIEAQLRRIDLKQSLMTLADSSDFQGLLNLDFSGASQGIDLETIKTLAKGKGTFTIAEPVLKNLNIEQTLCDLAARISTKYAVEKTWPEQTAFNTINGNFQLNGNNLELPSLTTGVGNIAVNAKGSVKLKEQQLNILTINRLSKANTSAEGCTVSSRLVNQDIPVQCAGSFAENGKLSCRPDEQWVNRAIQNLLLQELQNRFLKKAEPKQGTTNGDTTAEETQEQQQETQEKPLEQLLRGIFKQ